MLIALPWLSITNNVAFSSPALCFRVQEQAHIHFYSFYFNFLNLFLSSSPSGVDASQLSTIYFLSLLPITSLHLLVSCNRVHGFCFAMLRLTEERLK